MKRILTAAGAAVLTIAALSACAPGTPAATITPTSSRTPEATGPALPPGLTPSAIAALPAAVYDAVIPGLLAAPADPRITHVSTVAFDAPVYGADFTTAVARIPAKDFLGKPTVVVPVETKGGWSMVLTASRQLLPSQAGDGATAPAQTAAWLPTAALGTPAPLAHRVVVSVSAQTLTITDADGKAEQTFPVGVGTAETPTPTGTTGYLQARYLDPAQGQAVHRIQLTSLHATAADEPYGGADGGLIGIHYQDVASGAVSHGCIRMGGEGIAAVDRLPLGTPITVQD
ncbi:L,D-transpeptidase family protein [Microbacterium sp. X-17]|uniref:L,D-transpeptidase n=1 Tax=Microbacterium sp. X-17 TaxID=3144404 RepID=UPI0031F4D080